jgi:hypothetical protein
MTSKQFNVQKTVHLLPVSFDVAEIINGFLFIDIETFIKNKKSEMLNDIQKSNHFIDTDDGYWRFTNANQLIMANMMCKKCGNYLKILTFSERKKYKKNILCSCYDLKMYD